MLDWRVWRHPRPRVESGLCIGRTDVPIDPLEARRCADDIVQVARREALEPVVWTSTLTRARDVGRMLANEGWMHRVDADLDEFDFGDWDGRPWSRIDADAIARWEHDFMHGRVGDRGESLVELFARVDRCIERLPACAVIVGHAGWINALRWRVERTDQPSAALWPPSIEFGAYVRIKREG